MNHIIRFGALHIKLVFLLIYGSCAIIGIIALCYLIWAIYRK